MKRHHPESQPNAERGQGLLEFAMVVSILLLLLFGIIDFSRIIFGYATMSNGVREGARYAVVHPKDTAGIQDAAHAMMIVIGAPVSVSVGFPDTAEDGTAQCMDRLCRVVVTATSNFPVWTPLIPNIQMEARATMHLE